MMSRVICFASAKGGTGKTVIAASLAKLLASLGKNVLLVDVDAATNGLSLLYLEKLVDAKRHLDKGKISGHGIFEITENELPSLLNIGERLDIIPATYVMKQTESVPEETFRKSISQVLDAFRDKYEYIILDAQAGANLYAQIAIESANEIVIVSEYDPISAEGVDRLRRLFPEALSYDRTWILFNKVLPEFASSLSDFLSAIRYLSPIPWDAEVVRAFASRRLALDMENGNDYTLAIVRTTSSLLGEEIEEEIDRWKKDKEEFFRAPARSQLQAIEEEISLMEQAQIRIEYKLKDVRGRSQFFLIYSIVVLVTAIIVASTSMQFSSSLIMQIDLLIAAIGSAIIFYLHHRIGERARREETQLEGQVRAFTRRIEDLKERKKKYKTLAESDLETLFKKG